MACVCVPAASDILARPRVSTLPGAIYFTIEIIETRLPVPGVVPEPACQVPQAGEAAAEGPGGTGGVAPGRLQRHDARRVRASPNGNLRRLRHPSAPRGRPVPDVRGRAGLRTPAHRRVPRRRLVPAGVLGAQGATGTGLPTPGLPQLGEPFPSFFFSPQRRKRTPCRLSHGEDGQETQKGKTPVKRTRCNGWGWIVFCWRANTGCPWNHGEAVEEVDRS